METFNFPMHKVSIKYEDVDTQMQFGGGYSFTAEGDSPSIRSFELKFNGFKFYVDEEGDYDEITNAAINNIKALENFYLAHRTYKHFIFPLHGLKNVTCRFRTPFEIPEGLAGGGGVVAPFTIQLIEKP